MVEARTVPGDINEKVLLAVADSWQRIGVAVEPVVVPAARVADQQYRSEFPAFDLLRGRIRVEEYDRFHSAGAQLPENRFRGAGRGTNYSRYVNPEMDALVERFYATIPRGERMQLAGQIAHLMTDQLPLLPMFFDSNPVLAARRIANIKGRTVWNAHEWDLRG